VELLGHVEETEGPRRRRVAHSDRRAATRRPARP
jgi:hypothetical protein